MHEVRVMNRKLSRSAIIPSETFVEFKRKLVTELCLSGWLSVKVYKADSFEDVTEELLERDTGTNVTVETFPFIKFDTSVLVASRSERPCMAGSGRSVMVVHQGHDDLQEIDILKS